jgi:hypothetical protein
LLGVIVSTVLLCLVFLLEALRDDLGRGFPAFLVIRLDERRNSSVLSRHEKKSGRLPLQFESDPYEYVKDQRFRLCPTIPRESSLTT